MNRSHLISHPGPKAKERRQVVQGHARVVEFRLQEGLILMDAVARMMDELGCDSAMLVLDGLEIGPFNFVKPTMNSPDGLKVAWYSDTFNCKHAVIKQAMASVGKKDGDWFLHCHALWEDDGGVPMAGHLWPDQVTIAKDCDITCYAFEGGHFDVSYSEETTFSTFKAKALKTPAKEINAAIVTLSPHEDFGHSMPEIATELGFSEAQVLGLGSLIGADFKSGPSMEGAASELFMLAGATPNYLPLAGIDANWCLVKGEVIPGTVPVCITFELMLLKPDA